MPWSKLLESKRLKHHKTSPKEVSSLKMLIDRDLNDANIPEVSSDRRFATAYNAVLQLSKLLIACAGYRTSSSVTGHHKTTFEAVRIALKSEHHHLIDYFESCRRMRNILEYEYSEVASEKQAEELLKKAKEFKKQVFSWIKENHSKLLNG